MRFVSSWTGVNTWCSELASGALVAIDSRRRRFGGQLRHQLVLTNDTCATPWCDAPVRHADHGKPVRTGGRTALTNGSGLCEACNHTKELPGWTATILLRCDGSKVLDLTSPTGHLHHSRAPDPPGPPGLERASEPPWASPDAAFGC